MDYAWTASSAANRQVRAQLQEAARALRASRVRLTAARQAIRASHQQLQQTIEAAQATVDTVRVSKLDRELLRNSEIARLLAQLRTMPVIEQAKGVLIAQTGCTAEQAFDRLRQASQRSNVPIRELADQIVTSNVRTTPAQQPISVANGRGSTGRRGLRP